MTDAAAHPVPMADAISFDPDGSPYLAGQRCSACGEIVPGRHLACPKCCTVGSLASTRLGTTGTIFAWTIVERSFPGVKVPLVSAVIALEGGGYIKGNVEGLPATPEAVVGCTGVSVAFETLTAPDGVTLVRYVFHPHAGPDR